jgi:DNA-binding transcriptional LysR family regulator
MRAMAGVRRGDRDRWRLPRRPPHLRFAGVLNVHHLELFYYVARFGGISRAVRRMPYGIQQPAVSGQMLQLEESLGGRLFERSPFQLTPAGEQLFAFAQPFFENLDAIETQLRAPAAPLLRIGASELALRHYLGDVIDRLRETEPKLRLGLRSGFQPELEAWLEERAIDIAVAPLDRRPAKRIRVQPLVRVPLVLQVPKAARLKSAEELWRSGSLDQPLICLPETESLTRRFRKGLSQRGLEWPTAIEASSLESITAYVASGFGLGVNVGLPEVVRHRRVRVLPLDGFAPLEIAAMWIGEPTLLGRRFIEEAGAYVRKTWPAAAIG